MRFPKIISSLILLTHICACKSQDVSCSALLKEKVRIDSPLVFLADLHNLEKCRLDSYDVKIFSENRAFLSYLIISQVNKGKKTTYRDLVIMKNNPVYIKMKKDFIKMDQLKSTLVTDQNWEENKTFFLSFTSDKDNIDLNSFYQKYGHQQITYRQLFIAYGDEIKANKAKKDSIINESYNSEVKALASSCDTSHLTKYPGPILAINDYETGISCAKKMNKPVLVYFAGFACTNSRLMEENVFQDSAVMHCMKNDYVLIAVNDDDHTPLPKNRIYKSSTGETIKTVGDLNTDIEETKFKTTAMPNFVVLDKKGNIVNTLLGYQPDKKKFLKFLKDARAKCDE